MPGPSIRYEELERVDSPGGEMVLVRYTSGPTVGYEIALDGSFLMATHGSHSEEALYTFAAEGVESPGGEPLSVLVGGLGTGFTTRRALDDPRVGRVVVVEIVPDVVRYNRTYFAPYNGGIMDDARLEVVEGDLFDYVATTSERYHVVVTDCDNGPEWLARGDNHRLYSPRFFAAIQRLLAPGGVFGIWAPDPIDGLSEVLHGSFSRVEERSTRAIGVPLGEGGDVIYLAKGG